MKLDIANPKVEYNSSYEPLIIKISNRIFHQHEWIDREDLQQELRAFLYEIIQKVPVDTIPKCLINFSINLAKYLNNLGRQPDYKKSVTLKLNNLKLDNLTSKNLIYQDKESFVETKLDELDQILEDGSLHTALQEKEIIPAIKNFLGLTANQVLGLIEKEKNFKDLSPYKKKIFLSKIEEEQKKEVENDRHKKNE